jgi:hypothetical protein
MVQEVGKTHLRLGLRIAVEERESESERERERERESAFCCSGFGFGSAGLPPVTLHKVGKWSTTALHPQPSEAALFLLHLYFCISITASSLTVLFVLDGGLQIRILVSESPVPSLGLE